MFNALKRYIFKDIKFFAFKILLQLNKKVAISLQYFYITKKKLNLKHPTSFNEKIQWLKLFWYDSNATKCADKFEVREFVTQRGLESSLNELYGVYNSVNEINIDNLPKSFVLKLSHGSGWNVICKDKSTLNQKKVLEELRIWQQKNYYWRNGEWVYKDIKPRIVCEKYLEDENGEPPKDYKIFCFNGNPKLIQVDFDRFENHGRNFYDLEWNYVDLEIQYPSNPNVSITQPKELKDILNQARILSKGFPHVRVDFYIINKKVIFGELTFFHESGFGKFNSEDFNREMGSWITLPVR